MEVAEEFFRPEIDTALTGIAMGEFDDSDALRQKKQNERNDPEPDRYPTVGCDRWNDIQVENCDNEKQHEIAAAESADQVRLGGLGGSGDCKPRRLKPLCCSNLWARPEAAPFQSVLV